LTAEHEDNTHLKNNPKSIPNIISVKFFEALSAIPTLKQKRVAHGGLSEPILEGSSLTCKDDWGEGIKGFEDRLKVKGVGVFGQLVGRLRLPTVHRPFYGGWRVVGGGGAGGGTRGGGPNDGEERSLATELMELQGIRI